MDAHLQAFDACLKEALAQTREWVPRWLDRLHGDLKDKELSARQLGDKQVFVEARTALESMPELPVPEPLLGVRGTLMLKARQRLSSRQAIAASLFSSRLKKIQNKPVERR